MSEQTAIGILGGMGPQAGIDLASKIVAQTKVKRDQDHIPTILYSDPLIPDRTHFLLGDSTVNPGNEMAKGLLNLERSGAKVAGVACNTAHSALIFDHTLSQLKEAHSSLEVLHLIDVTVEGIRARHPSAKRIGILGTKGTYHFRLYDDRLEAAGLLPLRPDTFEHLEEAIYHSDSGIKACSSPVSDVARQLVFRSADQVIQQGAEVVILGCTELPIAVPEATYKGIPLIDPGLFMARALIQAVAPDRLMPLSVA